MTYLATELIMLGQCRHKVVLHGQTSFLFSTPKARSGHMRLGIRVGGGNSERKEAEQHNGRI